ncbi:thiamine pyrophosphate-binding protein [Urbifossiella limnaea]|uniref:Benzoylformate decarboxylase n=1 Tax=Urbifossiella limnaea TaxID=2528023 RepID=A0A517XQZ7_9BACT|nr:thiamine pyrophosphate-binding protein [Urbifossiella limnaea]QDU19937.1 Benzoylformate decarboxylase [Urbifossiella limnaea]
MTGVDAFLELLHGAGVTHLFGNPGTTELPLNAALARDRRVRYVLGLHECPVVAAADGYATAGGRLAVVNLHTSCGLGNAMGMLVNAKAAGSPLLVTAGQQDTRHLFEEPVLAGPLVDMARPLVKYAAEVGRVADLPNATRRAIQAALTPPTGPVFLSLPLDVQTALADGLDLSPPWSVDRHIRPARTPLQQAATLLANAANPVILAGSRVTESGGCRELVSLAETLGVPVFNEQNTSRGRFPIPTDHPLYAGPVPLWNPDIPTALAGFDVAFVVGMNLLRLYIRQEPLRPLPPGLKLIHLDNDPAEIGKNYPVEVGLLGDPKAGLAELVYEIDRRLTPDAAAAAGERGRAHAARLAAARDDFRAAVDAQLAGRPLAGSAVMGAVARVLPADAAVVEECPTTHGNVLERLGAVRDPAGYFGHRGWALGWGIGCAIGVKLAWPDRPVLAVLGDGSTAFGMQGLWTAAREGLPVVFVVANNRRYHILEVCGDRLGLSALAHGPGFTLGDPPIDFVGLSRALGVEAHSVERADELSDRVRAGLTGDRPVLLEVPVG